MKAWIDLDLTANAKDKINHFMAQIPPGHVLTIIHYGTSGEAVGEWGISAYVRDRVDALEHEVLSTLIYVIDGIEIYPPVHCVTHVCRHCRPGLIKR